MLHFALKLLHLLHFALSSCHILHRKLLHFGLTLLSASIGTFCGVTVSTILEHNAEILLLIIRQELRCVVDHRTFRTICLKCNPDKTRNCSVKDQKHDQPQELSVQNPFESTGTELRKG